MIDVPCVVAGVWEAALKLEGAASEVEGHGALGGVAAVRRSSDATLLVCDVPQKPVANSAATAVDRGVARCGVARA